ncbi:hypothetical protein GCM10027073_68830 [Streptomyces chlorus]
MLGRPRVIDKYNRRPLTTGVQGDSRRSPDWIYHTGIAMPKPGELKFPKLRAQVPSARASHRSLL